MRALIEAERPQDGIVGEEFGVRAGTSGRQWVLDPIDGTRAFISGRPIFGTLIALVVERWPMIGVIDQPIARERWTGAVGRATKIGRASCRERVCQYVSISGVAGTLKKKK